MFFIGFVFFHKKAFRWILRGSFKTKIPYFRYSVWKNIKLVENRVAGNSALEVKHCSSVALSCPLQLKLCFVPVQSVCFSHLQN